MKKTIVLCVAWNVLISLAIAQAPGESQPTPSRAQRAPTAPRITPGQTTTPVPANIADLLQQRSQANAPVDRQILLDIVIAAVAEADTLQTAGQLLEMAKQGKLNSVAQLQLTASEGKQAQVQMSRTPASASTSVASGTPTSAPSAEPRNAPQQPATRSDNFITATAQAISRLDENGAVVVDLRIGCSRSANGNRGDSDTSKATDANPSVATESFSIQSTLALRPGEPQVISTGRNPGGDAAATRVVVTATVSAAPDKRMQVYYLRNAKSDTTADMLRQMIQKSSVAITSDPRLNAIYVSAVAEDQVRIGQLIKIVEQPVNETPSVLKPRFIPIQHGKAADVAKIVREVYASRIDDPTRPAQPDPNNQTPPPLIPFGRRNPGLTQRMTLAVAEDSNSLVVTAPDSLFEEVKAFVAAMDQAPQPRRTLEELNDAIRKDPNSASAYRSRGAAYEQSGEVAKAIADYQRVVELQPGNPLSREKLARLLATTADDTLRDGKKALEHATAACEATGWTMHRYLDTLAAAYAETGDFEQAVKWAAKAVALTPNGSRKDEYQSRLELYQSGKPFRQPIIEALPAK